jgi:transcriptional regulator with XRE-family HTH domain
MARAVTDIQEELAGRLRRSREEGCLTQLELARRLRVPVRSLQDYEAGKALPRAARRRRILAFLNEGGSS